MTIHQLKERCWELDPLPPREDYHRHYDSRKEAAQAIREARRDDDCFNPDTKPRQMDGPCWLVLCDGDCEQHIDEEDEGYISHCESRSVAEELAAAYDWKCVGDLVFCETDAPADGQVPPPSPAELEAAGQLRLPGVA